jgi:hypothetical protein
LRSWTRLAPAIDRAEARGEEVAPETVTGRVGMKHGKSFLAFLAHRHEVPSFAEIVADPKNTSCPTTKQLGACFFVTGMICHHVTGANFKQVSEYLKRLPAEIDAAAVGMMKPEKRKEILMSQSGQAWLQRVQHIIA